VLAKRASKDNAFVKNCCRLAKKAAMIHVQEETSGLVRIGVSRVISFVAAVLVEGISLQAAGTGTIAEGTLRCILPFILNACNGKDSLGVKCSDWRGFGHILASCVAEHSVLSEEAHQTLATSLVQGAVELQKHLENQSVDDDIVVEKICSALVTLMAVLSTSADNSNEATQLAIVGRKAETFIGFPLPGPTYRAIVNLPCFVTALGYLCEERGFEVADLVASVLVTSLKNGKGNVILELVS
jgi:hypothetical protein